MLKFWLKRDLKGGLYNISDVEIVEAHYFDGDFDGMEPSVSLADIEAMQRYIQGQFPLGWRIVNGRVRGK